MSLTINCNMVRFLSVAIDSSSQDNWGINVLLQGVFNVENLGMGRWPYGRGHYCAALERGHMRFYNYVASCLVIKSPTTFHYLGSFFCQEHLRVLLKTMILKVVSATFLLVPFVSLKENTCEARKSIYFTSTVLFVLKIIKILWRH